MLSEKNTLDDLYVHHNEFSGVQIHGASNRILDSDVVFNGESGIELLGEKNLAAGNNILSNAEGVGILGPKNRVLGNMINANSHGIDAHGAAYKVAKNVVDDNDDYGIQAVSPGKILKNFVRSNTDYGIEVSGAAGTKIKVVKNETSANGTDLFDHTSDCGDHVWKKNVFTTKNPACIE